MGNNSNRDQQVQSQPNLPLAYSMEAAEPKEAVALRTPVSKKEIIDGFLEKIKKQEEEKKELKNFKKGEVRIKKTKENCKIDKENEF